MLLSCINHEEYDYRESAYNDLLKLNAQQLVCQQFGYLKKPMFSRSWFFKLTFAHFEGVTNAASFLFYFSP